MSVSATFESPQKTSVRNLLKAFLSLRHCAPKPHVVFGPVVYVQITHAREWIKPMASGLQKNEQSGRNHTFVASSHRHANIEEALSKKSRMGTEKFPCVSASNAMSDAAHARYEKVNCAEVSGIRTTKHLVVKIIARTSPAHTDRNWFLPGDSSAVLKGIARQKTRCEQTAKLKDHFDDDNKVGSQKIRYEQNGNNTSSTLRSLVVMAEAGITAR